MFIYIYYIYYIYVIISCTYRRYLVEVEVSFSVIDLGSSTNLPSILDRTSGIWCANEMGSMCVCVCVGIGGNGYTELAQAAL